MTVLDGGLADLRDDFILGNGSTGNGTALVSGVNGAFRSTVEANNGGGNSNVRIGLAGYGDLTIADGGLVTTSGSAFVRQSVNSQGSLTIGGSNGGFDATLDVAGGMGIGGTTGSAGGTADVTINEGGLLQVAGAFKLWNLDTLTHDGGAVSANAGLDASAGTLDFLAGSLTINSGINIGSESPFPQNLTLSTHQTLL